ncbi:hypothetical protein HFP15_24745 [Amycolatopsis sp. K13G38]|uniref:Zn-ribbon domain-containing OB-fold protein n=1 Tax=Amycolatopsis acididurans TaxID=2724524 RepID=A0ABX1J8H1_9PSEU|nr:OB-fold domain-containing protein [Amycolatopsis acididurans]NKQ56091.1 hypothetical protein [Amycolatopsis acididurans]
MTATYVRPLPTISPQNQVFWDGLKERKFQVPRCDSCGAWNWSPYPACRECLSTDQTWTQVSGRGTVYSFAIVTRAPSAFADIAPYVWAWIELEEKPRTMLVQANVINCDPYALKIGDPVRIAFEDVPGEDITLYKFEPAGHE